jgi:hypothetical protein
MQSRFPESTHNHSPGTDLLHNSSQPAFPGEDNSFSQAYSFWTGTPVDRRLAQTQTRDISIQDRRLSAWFRSQGKMPGERGWVAIGCKLDSVLLPALSDTSAQPIFLDRVVHECALYGIGMALDVDDGPVVVRKVIDLRNPAGESINGAVNEGDVLLALDGNPVRGLHGRAMSDNMILGTQSTQVKLTLQSGKSRVTYTVVCTRHVPIRSWALPEVAFTTKARTEAGLEQHSGQKEVGGTRSPAPSYVVGEEIIDILNSIMRILVDESGQVVDLLQPLQQWQVDLCALHHLGFVALASLLTCLSFSFHLIQQSCLFPVNICLLPPVCSR